jgi:hypothetical protein
VSCRLLADHRPSDHSASGRGDTTQKDRLQRHNCADPHAHLPRDDDALWPPLRLEVLVGLAGHAVHVGRHLLCARVYARMRWWEQRRGAAVVG